jgi:type IV secretory pathway TrbD component
MFQSLHLDGSFVHKILITKVLIDEPQRNRPLHGLFCAILTCVVEKWAVYYRLQVVLWVVQWRAFLNTLIT